MKTITERDGKNVNMQVVGDLHQYPDGSVHTVKEGKAVWEEGGGSGYTVEETKTTAYNGTVTGTEMGDGAGIYGAALDESDLSAPISGEILVTYNGTEYKCDSWGSDAQYHYYGATYDAESGFDFSEYPFLVQTYNGIPAALIMMTSQGPNTLKVETVSETVTPTDEFKAAVNASVEGGVFVVGVTLGEGQTLTCDKTAEEIYDAFEAGQVVQFETPLDGAVMKSLLLQAGAAGTAYIFMFMYDSTTVVCQANSGSAYPSGTLSE